MNFASNSSSIDPNQRRFLVWLRGAFQKATQEGRTEIPVQETAYDEAFSYFSRHRKPFIIKVAKWHVAVAENLLRRNAGMKLHVLPADPPFPEAMVEDLERELISTNEEFLRQNGRPREGSPVPGKIVGSDMNPDLAEKRGVIFDLIAEKVPHAPGKARECQLYPALRYAFLKTDPLWDETLRVVTASLSACGFEMQGFDIRWWPYETTVPWPQSVEGASAGTALALLVGKVAAPSGPWKRLDFNDFVATAKIGQGGVLEPVGDEAQKLGAVLDSIKKGVGSGPVSTFLVANSSLDFLENSLALPCYRSGARLYIDHCLVIGASDLQNAAQAIDDERHHSLWKRLANPAEPLNLYFAYRSLILYLRGEETADIFKNYPWLRSDPGAENDFGRYLLTKCWDRRNDPASKQFVLIYPQIAAAVHADPGADSAAIGKKLIATAGLNTQDEKHIALHLADVLYREHHFRHGTHQDIELGEGLRATLHLESSPILQDTQDGQTSFLPSYYSGHLVPIDILAPGLEQIKQQLPQGSCYLWTITLNRDCNDDEWKKIGPPLLRALSQLVAARRQADLSDQRRLDIAASIQVLRSHGAKLRQTDMDRGMHELEKFQWTVNEVVADHYLRAKDVADLEQNLNETSSAVGIYGVWGAGGLGKTQLVRSFARNMLFEWVKEPRICRFPGGVIEINLRAYNSALSGDAKPLTTDEARELILRDLGISEATLEAERKKHSYAENALEGFYQRELLRRNVLLILDNAWDEAQVEPLLPPDGSACRAIVTSRRELAITGDRFYSAPLDNWDWPDFQRYFRNAGVFEVDGFFTNSPARIGDLCKQICTLTKGLPLAAKVIAGFATSTRAPDHQPIIGLVIAHLEKHASQSDQESLNAVLDLCVDTLPTRAQELYEMLAVFPVHFDAAATAAVWGQSITGAEELLRDLYAKGLINREGSVVLEVGASLSYLETYRLHDRIRQHAVERSRRRADHRARSREVELQFAAHYIGRQALYNQLLIQDNPLVCQVLGPANISISHTLFSTDAPNFTAAFERLCYWEKQGSQEAEDQREVWELGSLNGGVATRACDLFLSAPQREERIQFALHCVDQLLSVGSEIHHKRLLREKAIHYISRGLAFRHQDRRDKADEDFARPLQPDLVDAITDLERGASLGNLGNIFYERFIATHERAQKIDYLEKSMACHLEAERCSQAVDEKLALAQDWGNQAIILMWQWWLAVPGSSEQTYDDALQRYQMRIELALSPRLNDLRGAGNGSGNAGTLLLQKAQRVAQEKVDEAFKLGLRAVGEYKRAIWCHHFGKNPRGVAANQGNLGRAYRILASFSPRHRKLFLRWALERNEKSYKLFCDVGDTDGARRSLWNILAVLRQPDAPSGWYLKQELYLGKMGESSLHLENMQTDLAALEKLAEVHLSDKYGKLSVISLTEEQNQNLPVSQGVYESVKLSEQLLLGCLRKIRPATVDDIPAICRIVEEHLRPRKDTLQERAEGFLITNFGERYRDWLKYITVVEYGGLVVGFTLAFPSTEIPDTVDDTVIFMREAAGQPFTLLKQIGVARGWQRKGVGQVLYRDAMEKISDQLFVPVLIDNAVSSAFQEKQGLSKKCEYAMAEDDVRALWVWQRKV